MPVLHSPLKNGNGLTPESGRPNPTANPPKSFYYKKSNYKNALGQALQQTLKYVNPRTLIDVGTYRGDVICNLLAYRHPFTHITGVDLSQNALKQAEKLVQMACRELEVSPTLSFQQGDVKALTFKNKQFDLLTTHGCLIHVHQGQIKQALSECLRVATHCFFVESSCDGADTGKSVSDEVTRRYWEVRSRYYSLSMMSDRLRKKMEQVPYYYSHDYPTLFKSLKAKLIEKVLLDENTFSYGYLVKGGK